MRLRLEKRVELARYLRRIIGRHRCWRRCVRRTWCIRNSGGMAQDWRPVSIGARDSGADRFVDGRAGRGMGLCHRLRDFCWRALRNGARRSALVWRNCPGWWPWNDCGVVLAGLASAESNGIVTSICSPSQLAERCQRTSLSRKAATSHNSTESSR